MFLFPFLQLREGVLRYCEWCGILKINPCVWGCLCVCVNFSEQVEHHLFVVSRDEAACDDDDICPRLSARLQQSADDPFFSLLLSLLHVTKWGGGVVFGNGIHRLERDDSGMW